MELRIGLPTVVRMQLRGTWIAKQYAQGHVRLYRATHGRLGGRLKVPHGKSAPLLLLTTTGRKTGQPRTTPLLFVVAGDDVVVVPANAGHPADPAWWLNLQASPAATVQRRSSTYAVTARTATDAEAEAIWPAVLDVYPPYADYQAATTRAIPLVILMPVVASRDA